MDKKPTRQELLQAEGIRSFHIGDILTITTDRVMSKRHMEGVYDILNYMTDDNLFTHQLPRAREECSSALREQLPDIGALEVPDFEGEEQLWSWLGKIAVEYGETHPVLPLHPEDHTMIGPIDELRMMGHGDKLVVFEPPPQDDQ